MRVLCCRKLVARQEGASTLAVGLPGLQGVHEACEWSSGAQDPGEEAPPSSLDVLAALRRVLAANTPPADPGSR